MFRKERIKLEISEAYLLRLGKNLSQDFQVIYFFVEIYAADISNGFITTTIFH